MKNNQNGATMLEAIATITVASVLLISSIRLIGSLFDMFKQNMVTGEIRELKKNIQSRYSFIGNYLDLKDVTAATLVKEKIVPNGMIANGKIYHKLGGEVVVNLSPVSADNIYFDVTFKDLTTRGCLNLSQVNWIVNNNTDLVQLKINDKTFVLPVGENKGKTEGVLPLTMKSGNEACKSGSGNVMTWTFQ